MKFWSIENLTAASLDLMLYGPIFNEKIFDEDVTPTELRHELEAAGPVQQINVFLNSPGGNVFAGSAIYSILQRHQANVTVYVDGLAASIASVIAMAGDEVVMPRNAMMMIHSPWALAVGNAEELRDLADVLDKVEGSMMETYMTRFSGSRAELKALLDAETWLSAADAVQYGLADRIEEQKEVAALAISESHVLFGDRVHDIAAFKTRPELQQPQPRGAAQQRQPERQPVREHVRQAESRHGRHERQQKLAQSEAASRRHEREARHV